MPYREPKTWEFTLEAIGAPEFRVVCVSAEDLEAGDQLRTMKAMAILRRAQRRQDIGEGEEWAISAADEFLKKVIVDWNLVYPPRHPLAGQPIPLRRPIVVVDDPGTPKRNRKGEQVIDADGEPVWEGRRERVVDDPDYDPFESLPAYVYSYILTTVMGAVATPPKSGPR